jgi:nucleotide-binding universal stress UspA family protein
MHASYRSAEVDVSERSTEVRWRRPCKECAKRNGPQALRCAEMLEARVVSAAALEVRARLLRCCNPSAARGRSASRRTTVLHPKKPYVIVVGVDYSESGELALEQALSLAAERGNSELHAIHVISLVLPALPVECAVPSNVVNISLDQAAKELAQHLTKSVNVSRERGVLGVDGLHVFTHVRCDMPARRIAQLAADFEADLVVIGSQGRRGLPRCVLGSVAEAVVRLAPCPVLVVRPKGIVTPTIESRCPECGYTRVDPTASDGSGPAVTRS